MATCDTDCGSSPSSGAYICPMRTVVRPFVRSAYATRRRRRGCSSPNGGASCPPKKSTSRLARGLHPSTLSPAVKSSRRRVVRMSPSVKVLWPGSLVLSAHSAFWPWPNVPNSARFMNRVPLTSPEMRTDSPSSSFTGVSSDCDCAAPGVGQTAIRATRPRPRRHSMRVSMGDLRYGEGALRKREPAAAGGGAYVQAVEARGGSAAKPMQGATAVTGEQRGGPRPAAAQQVAAQLRRGATASTGPNAELLCVLGVQSLPAAELHGLGADHASNRLTREEPLKNVEADVPARGAPRDEAAIDVMPEREARTGAKGFEFPPHIAVLKHLGSVG